MQQILLMSMRCRVEATVGVTALGACPMPRAYAKEGSAATHLFTGLLATAYRVSI
jgi:hypothetical protein